MPDPANASRVVAILLGAAKWPRWSDLKNEVFEDSHKKFRAYLEESLHLTPAEILDFFGSEASPDELVKEIEDLSSKSTIVDIATDLIVHYVGHGHTSSLGGEYAIFTACARKD